MAAYYMNELAFELPDVGFVDRTIYDGKDYNGYRYPLLKALGSGLVTDPAWQPETTASFINKDGEKTYANPTNEV